MSGVIAASTHSPSHAVNIPDEHHVHSPASVRGTGTNKNDNNNNNGDNDDANFDLCRQMKPFLLCLRLTGLLRTCSSRETVTAPRKWTWCDLLLHIHNAVVLVLLWLNLGLALSGFTSVTSFDGSLCNQLVTSAWFLQVALAASNHLRQSPRLVTFLLQYRSVVIGHCDRSFVKFLAVKYC